VSGTPVVVGLVGALVVIGVLMVLLTRDPGLAARVSAHYVDTMAGELAPRVLSREPEALARDLAAAGLPFTPRVTALEPDLELVGGAVHEVSGRPVGAWFYRNTRADTVLVEAFRGTLDELGEPDQTRAEREPPLYVFHKASQTLLFWQEEGLVYVLVSTFPTERAAALARRLASPAQAE
jgi:hypothetical protein